MTSTRSMAVLLERLVDDAQRDARQKILDDVTRAVTSLTKQYELGIITALPVETVAVGAAFGEALRLPSNIRNAVNFFELSMTIGEGKDQRTKYVILAQCAKMGNNSAAVAATAMLLTYPSVSDIILVGIAGGVPHIEKGTGPRRSIDDHVRKGDIVVGEQVIQYDMLKMEIDKHENRGRSMQPSSRLLRAVSNLEQDALRNSFPWEDEIDKLLDKLQWSRPSMDVLHDFEISDAGVKPLRKNVPHPRQRDRRMKRPFIHRGNIGSANILLKNPAIREHLRTALKIRAVEMEGSGVADAAWTFSAGYLVIRGVCDYCDMSKDDAWQKYAALAAASYAKLVVAQALFE
jgi:nucleoside phosphorylase